MVATSRLIAISILNKFNDNSGLTLDDLIEDEFKKMELISRADRALAVELVSGVVRWRIRLDWLIQHLSKTPIRKIEPRVLNAIRLGVYQIVFLTRVPASAAVNDSVELVKAVAAPYVVKFANGVLRAASTKASAVALPTMDKDPVEAICVEQSHPKWLVKKWVDRMGIEDTHRLCCSNNEIPPISVRTNSLRVSRERLLDCLRDEAHEVKPTPYSPHGINLRKPRRSLREMDAYKQGWFQVQDEAAQLSVLLLDPKPGERILDACAGRGGKTGYIGQLMNNTGEVVAADSQQMRLSTLSETMKCLGISSVKTWHMDLLELGKDEAKIKFAATFDRVFLDAPCSGLGVIRRKPDIKWRKELNDLKTMHKKQLALLDTVGPLVKPGGVLVYCVCSLEPEEGASVLNQFLGSRDDFVIDTSSCPSALTDNMVNNEFIDEKGFFRSWPNKHNMDGFFAARILRKQ